MEPYQPFTRHISQGSDGAVVGAFFDLDGTLIDTHSVKDVFTERLIAGQVSSQEVIDLLNMAVLYALKAGSFEDALTSSVRNIRGLPEKQFEELGKKVFRDRLAPVIFPQMKAVIREHQAVGHRLVIITSATAFQVEPLAKYFGIDDILCTRLAVKNGTFTGELEGEPCYGGAKLVAAREFAGKHGLQLGESYFYSNGSEDLPLLEAVGHPVAVNPDKKLARTAKQHGWLMHQPENRGSTGVMDIARTLTTFSSVLPSFLVGLPFRFLGGSERDSTNFSLSTWAGFASIIAGLKLIVDGEEHLWSHRPAVFVFNHQSAMDILILAKLIRQDVVGVAKKEIKKQPFLGPAMALTGTVFIDRDKNSDPREALKPAVEALDRNRSIAIAPEGTRSNNERLGEFKTGAFHLAMQAGVPIVPIVIHNALDALPNKSMVVRPAEVKVTVLEPVLTGGWNKRSVYKNCREVRNAYLEILGQPDEGVKRG